MPKAFYDYDTIKSSSDCLEIARALGLSIDKKGRCAATWRGGSNPQSVSINSDGFCDHGDGGSSGSVIDLVALVQFSGDVQSAQEWLGEYLRLTPSMRLEDTPEKKPKTRYDELLEDGYHVVKEYVYTDATGAPVHSVLRLEHSSKPKQFVQRAADGKWTLKHISPVLYNLPAITASQTVYLVEGEKDADTLIARNLPASCNAMGAGKWLSQYTDALRGKDIIILRDSDDAGLLHAKLLTGQLQPVARSIRVPAPLSALPGGDVTDWLEKENGTIQQLLEIIDATQPVEGSVAAQEYELARAKTANKYPMRNFRTVKSEVGGVMKQTKEPIELLDLIRETFERFLGFPRKVGENLFDHDRDTGRIYYMTNHRELWSWIARKSKKNLEWTRGDRFATKEEFFAGIHAEAQRYESISFVPDWPKRKDVYYAHEALPPPDPNHGYLEYLIDFWNPSRPEFRALIKALFASPIYYEPSTPRPMWIIQSECPGVGKSSLATRVAILYGAPAVEVKQRDFIRDTQEITKRLVSSSGRLARVFLVDNVTGTFASEELSAMVTMPHISGKAPYGHGEESRPNNLTYIVTANNASIDNDISIRSFFIKLEKLDSYSNTWNRELNKYIEEYRLYIMADIVDILNSHTPFDCNASTRFPEFETMILQPMCGSQENYQSVLNILNEEREEANIEDEWGQSIMEMFRAQLAEMHIHPDKYNVWIRSQIADEWIHEAIPDARVRSGTQFARNLVNTGHLPRIGNQFKVWPHNPGGKVDRRKGLLWLCRDNHTTSLIHCVIAKKGKKTVIIDAIEGSLIPDGERLKDYETDF